MKVLYLLWNYPQLSETYVVAEIAFALSQGIDVRVLSTIVQKAGVPEQCQVYRGTLAEAIAAMRPDVIHIHYLVMAEKCVREIPAHIPVTVRAHSFDWSPASCLELSNFAAVRKIYAFPHFARQVAHPKVEALPVSYSSARFKTGDKDRKMVLRLSAGLPTKGLADFFAAAKELRHFRFVLGVARAGGAEHFIDVLRGMNKEGLVEILDLRFDLPWEEAARLTHQAGIYMDTSDPAGHLFGMPISIAEAMATGSYVIARSSPAAREYLDLAGTTYDHVSDATNAIRTTESWVERDWEAVARRAQGRAQLYADTAVLPKVMEFWKGLVHKE